MSIRTIIEINHDGLSHADTDLQEVARALHGTDITRTLNEGQPVYFGAVRILAQRHHSEDTTLTIGGRETVRL